MDITDTRLAFQLSPQQRTIWSLQQIGEIYYHKGMVVLEGQISPDVLFASVQKTLALHQAMCTKYCLKETYQFPFQVIEEAPDIRINHHVLAADFEEQEKALIEIARLEKEMQNGKNGKMRVSYYEISDTKGYLSLQVPAISCDSYSLHAIVQQIVGNLKPKVETLIQYPQFAEWQNTLLKTPDEEAIDFWEAFEYHLRSRPLLPTETPVADQKNFDSITVCLNADITTKLRELAGQHQMGIHDWLLIGFHILLARHLKTNKITIGFNFNQREYEELKDTIGAVAKLLPYQLNWEEDQPWTALMQNYISNMQDIEGWSTYFTNDYINKGHPSSPYFDFVFEYMDISAPFSLHQDLKAAWVTFENDTYTNVLKLNSVNYGDRILFHYHFDSKRLDKTYVGWLGKQYITVLESAIDNPDKPVSQVSMLSPTERSAILHSFNHPLSFPATNDSSLVHMFEKQVARIPEEIACMFDGKQLTYGALNAYANQLARFLQEKAGVTPGTFVGIFMDRSEWAVISIWAVLKCRATYVPIDKAYPAERIKYIVKDTAAKALLVDEIAILSSIEASNLSIVDLPAAKEKLGGFAPENLALDYSKQDLAYVIYTSGSTGWPKGVIIKMESLVNYVRWANDYYFRDKQRYTFGLFTALSFDLTLTSLFTTLTRGDQVAVYADENIDTLLKRIFEEDSVDVVKITPSHVLAMRESGITATDVHTVILGGEAVLEEQVRYLKGINAAMRIYNEYGPTETTVGCSVKDISEGHITIGKPIDNARMYIIDSHQQLTSIGIEGEIAVGGIGMAVGYLNNPRLTCEKFVNLKVNGLDEMVYLTGDKGYWLPDGELMYTGRIDDQIKIRGYRVELAEIASVLKRCKGIDHAIVAINEIKDGSKSIVAYVVGTYEEEKLQNYLTNHLPAYMIPDHIIPIKHIPLTLHGKIDRAALPSLHEIRQGQGNERMVPRNDIEEKLTAIWEEVLQVTPIGIRENFIKLGGHSLKAVKIASRIHKVFQKKISLETLYTHATIEQLGAFMVAAQDEKYEAIVPIPTAPHYDVSHAQKRFWIIDQIGEGRFAYNIPIALTLYELDRQAFSKAITTIIQRHEIFRTTFVSVGGVPKQKVHDFDTCGFKMDYLDLRNDALAEEKAQKLAEKEKVMRFDLVKGPLVKAKLLHIKEDHHVFLFSMHHVVCDEWSIEVLLQELLTLYECFKTGKENPLKPLRIQYKDYAQWHNQIIKGEVFKEDKKYWHEKLSGELPVLNLPLDYPRSQEKAIEAEIVNYPLKDEIRKQLYHFSHTHEVSMFTLCIAIYYILLYRYSGNKDIIVGAPVSGRNHVDLEDQVGIYINTLALRMRMDPEMSFIKFLYLIKQVILTAFMHQEYPFDLLTEELNIKPQNNRSAVFDVGFTFHPNISARNQKAAAMLKAESFGSVFKVVHSDLLLHVRESDDQIILSFDYAKALFKRSTIDKMLKRYELIMDQALQNDQIKIEDIKMDLERKGDNPIKVVSIDLDL